MAKEIYIGSDDKSKDTKNAYIGINNLARKIKKAYIGVNGVAKQFYSSGFVWKKYNVKYSIKETTIFSIACSKFDEPYAGTISYSRGRVGNLKGTTTSPILCDKEGLYIPSGTLRYPASYEGSSGFNIQRSRSIQWFCKNETIVDKHTDDETAETSPYIYADGVIYENTRYQKMYRVVGNWSKDYYYTYLVEPKEEQGIYISDVESDDPNAYPENGIKDGYWYVKQS